jgi:hypothetical protein
VPKNPTSTRISTIIGTTVVISLLDWFYLAYMASKGFEPRIHEFVFGTFKLPIPIQWLPVAGVVLVSFVVWYEVSFTIFPRRVALEQDTLSNIRLMRAIVLSLAVFVSVLYVPYIIGSDWFWARLSSASSISQIRGLGQSLLNTDQTLMGLDQIWQYSISQSAALMCMVLFALVFGRSPKRIRK